MSFIRYSHPTENGALMAPMLVNGITPYPGPTLNNIREWPVDIPRLGQNCMGFALKLNAFLQAPVFETRLEAETWFRTFCPVTNIQGGYQVAFWPKTFIGRLKWQVDIGLKKREA